MQANNMKIEILYFEDCPSWKKAIEILETVLADLNIEPHIALVRVETQEEAVAHQFVGSPSIRVNGEDLFPTGQDHFALGCRVYQTPEGFRGWPTAALLKEKLALHVAVT